MDVSGLSPAILVRLLRESIRLSKSTEGKAEKGCELFLNIFTPGSVWSKIILPGAWSNVDRFGKCVTSPRKKPPQYRLWRLE